MRREHLLELRQRRDRSFLHALHVAAGCGAQSDRDRDRILVVEQERRQLAAGLQLVAAADATRAATG